MKRVWMLSALALFASTPSSAQDTCAQAALAYYCTAVTTALGQTAGGDLGNALLAQSQEYGEASKRLGYSSLKQKFFERGVNDAADAKDQDGMQKLIKVCVSKDAEAMNSFMETTDKSCRKSAGSSDSSTSTSTSASSEVRKERSSP
jgi:hypothetical protein